jgi:hypothetical protein
MRVGINESPENISALISGMGLKTTLSADKKTVTVAIPPTRSGTPVLPVLLHLLRMLTCTQIYFTRTK